MLRIFSSMIIPPGLLFLAFFLYPKFEGLPESQLVIIQLLPLFIAIVGMSLCLRFNLSLIFFTILTLIVTYALMQWYLPSLGWLEAKTVWSVLCLLLPLNAVSISLSKERGILTWWGGIRLLFFLLPMLFFVLVAKYYPEPLLHLLNTPFTELYVLSQVNFAQLPLMMMVLAVLILNGRWFVRTTEQNGALFFSLISGIAMLYFKTDDTSRAIFANVAMLMLVVTVIQTSWSMAYIDQLTDLLGRRALEDALLKLGSSYSIAMLDIDHFKKFNDSYGHDAGDQVLKMVASRIKQSVSGGKVFRYGGEEFIIVFPGKRIKESLDVLEGVRENIGDNKFQLRHKDRRNDNRMKNTDKNVAVTISIGVAERTEHMTTPHEVVKSADKALYRAKKQGRNRVCK